MTKKNNLEITENKKVTKKVTAKKVKSMPQTFVEDTFDVSTGEQTKTIPIILENTVTKIENNKRITVEELLNSKQFKDKFDKLKLNVLFEKSFNELLDFNTMNKMYKSYYISDDVNEIDVLIEEIVKTYRQRLATISLDHETYKQITAFFDSLKTLYHRFNTSDEIIKDDLKIELDKLISMDRFMKINFFSYLK